MSTGAVRLAPVDASNREALAGVAPRAGQEPFVASVSHYLALCRGREEWTPLAILTPEGVVGFVMWAIDEDQSRWVGGLVIDAAQQGRGIGRGAIEALLAMFRSQPGATGAALACDPRNLRAMGLYDRLGFVATGELDDDEVVLRLPF